MKKNILKILTAVFAVTFVISLIYIIKYTVTSESEKKTFEDLFELVTVDEQTVSTNNGNTENTPQTPLSNVDIDKLRSLNKDSMGWINIPGTAINYPVMHTPYKPQKYLHLDFYQKQSKSGVPFMDDNQTYDNKNVFIYGHNMKNGTMFWDLRKFKNREFLKNNNQIYLKTSQGIDVYRIYAVIVTDVNSALYNYRGSISEAGFDNMMQYIDKNAYAKYGDAPNYSDKFLTLSTCGAKDDDRLLVVAVRQKTIGQ